MLFHAYGSHARPAAAVGDREGLVQVDVHHVRAQFGRPGDARQGVHVGAVQVHLAAVFVHQFADVDNPGFIHPVSGRVGDHQGGQARGMPFRLGAQVVQVDVAVVVAGDHHHIHAGHDRARRVGAVGRGRYQAHVTLALALLLLVLADHQQPGVLPLGTGIGLQREGGETGEVAQHVFQFLEQLHVALGLVQGHERVDGVEITV